ncbi:hypothetical protein SAY87_026323 [Trapa incisa]|uniref:t-SNARE coiled-coil homology domain-containing protein n=1 Tax=Trapa incisa TaxID=236973 RepID=A0AAN7GMX0_9MYRT|nr:hypothetical protein SAY87_026323 [Trapa incisa]
MFGSNKSQMKKKAASGSNPFDSDDEYDNKRHTSNPKREFDGKNRFGDQKTEGSSSLLPIALSSAGRNRYKNGFRDSGGLENQSVQELENYAVYKAEETTKDVNNCLKIAEDMRDTATKTLVMLHEQGEQITRAHRTAADIDHDLSRGEKLLGSLGGIFSKTWKPKKTRAIVGPEVTRDDVGMKGNHLEQREKLGLSSAHKGRPISRTSPSEPASSLQKVEDEKAKQDDALSDLSNILGDLKNMAIDMGSEIDRHNKALEPFHDDVDELNHRVKQANQRGRRLLN